MSELKLYRCLVGNQWNCSPRDLSCEEFMEKIFYAQQNFLELRPNTLFCPKPDFTNHVVAKGADDDVYSRKVINPLLGPGDPQNDHIIEIVMTRTKTPADGGIVELDLAWNNMGDMGAAAIFKALQLSGKLLVRRW